MKKICLSVFFFGVFILNSNTSVAKEPIASSGSEQKNIVKYDLPYPGLLPDSPLYFLRVTRDRIVDFLISDPLKKSEFDLLQADKRLNAAIYLSNKGEISLALSTASKAENYFEQAINKMGEAKMQGRNISEMEGKLRNALEKHQQELEGFVAKVNANFKQGFEKELKRVVNFGQRLSD